MTASPHPFLDAAVQADLYRDGARLAARTSALHQAKTCGRAVADVIADLVIRFLPEPRTAVVADLGCGRGTSSRVLVERVRPRRLIAVDASAAMLTVARSRLGSRSPAAFVQADFHHLPLPDASCAAAVAAFCLYHAPAPRLVLWEIARLLEPGGVTVLVTKSTDSYRALDLLVAAAGLDAHAAERVSLYASAHSGNLAALTAPILPLIHVEHEEHRFSFTGLDHVAAYLATSPKYDIPAGLRGHSSALAAALRARLPDAPVHTTSTVTYLVAARPGGTR
ncbi:class I SAM-dependent methyltransferase [Sphaerisporangium sp. NPDC088356]|uniref:class I SAM-dependent methyltransferase n=1 Tax=Sphaerisporangium sp. NPDC088356 TaxID=3154871 RepID=UPI00343D13BD